MPFHQLLDALRPYQHLDPAAWVGALAVTPLPVAAVLAALGWFLLAAHPTRLSGLVLAAFAALTWSPQVLNAFGLLKNEEVLSTTLCLVLCLMCTFIFRPTASFLIWGIPAGLWLGYWVGPLDFGAGFVPACVIVGTGAALFSQESQSVAGALVGGWFAVMGAARFLGIPLPATGNHSSVLHLIEAAATAALLSLAFHGSWRGARLRWRELTSYRGARQARSERKALEQRWSKR
jgi:hypothetical protein